MNAYHIIALSVFSFSAVACNVSAETIDPPGSTVQSDGTGACEMGGNKCVTWVGTEEVVGQCAASTSGGYTCCTGCVDARGNCQDGASPDSCGSDGSACVDCIAATGASCYLGGCSPRCATKSACDTFCVGAIDGTPCNMCGLAGLCANGACDQVQSGPSSCN